MLYEFHQYPQPYDDKMDQEFYEQYARILKEQSKWGYFNWTNAPDGTPRPTFSPSGAEKSDRELYEKAIHGRKGADPQTPTANQRDWTGTGSQIGAYIQREIMLIERHYEKLTGKKPKFRFERTERNEPSFEHFVKKIHEVEYNGEKFGLNGLPDGILIYTADDGNEYRVGLEVKSFQKSYVEFKKVSEPKPSHVLQTHCYSEMYNLDYCIVLLHLTYGVDWKKEINRNKTFGLEITQSDRDSILEKFANVTKAVRTKQPPKVDMSKWEYCDYKTAIANALTDEELDAIKNQVRLAMRSGLPDWKKQKFFDAYEKIKELREEASA